MAQTFYPHKSAQKLNLQSDFGAAGDGVTDDSGSLARAVAFANTYYRTNNVHAIIYAPAANYRILTPPGTMNTPTFIQGDGSTRTYFNIDTNFNGDLFAWSECWGPDSNTRAGGMGFSILGANTTNTSVIQNGMMFYNRNVRVNVEDIYVKSMAGWGIGIGMTPNTGAVGQAYVAESSFKNIRIAYCGTNTAPSMELTCAGAGDSTNEVKFWNVDIFNPISQGLLVRANTSVKGLTLIDFFGLRIEGQNPSVSAGVFGDLLQIGDPQYTGGINNIQIHGFHTVAGANGFAAVGIYANTAANNIPYNIKIDGLSLQTSSGTANGLNIQSGRSMEFDFASDTVASGIGVIVANSTLVGSPIMFDLGGTEALTTWTVDPTSANNLYWRPKASLFGSSAYFLNVPDNKASGGVARGAGAVDLQIVRSSNGQVATGQFSAILGGSSSTAAGQSAAVVGGLNNTADGIQSFIGGGARATTRARNSSTAFSAGYIINGTVGSSQRAEFHLIGTTASTTPVVLVASTTGTINANTIPSIPAASAYTFRVKLAAIDRTHPANTYSWVMPNGLMTRTGAASTTVVANGTPLILSTGTVTGLSVALSADTTNGGLTITFTPPTSNPDTWDVSATVETEEIQ